MQKQTAVRIGISAGIIIVLIILFVSLGRSGIRSFAVLQPNLVVEGADLARVEMWAIPTGTNITEADYIKLGEATLISEVGENERWEFPIPSEPILATEIFAQAFNAEGDEVGKRSLGFTGATEIANALWPSSGTVPPGNTGGGGTSVTLAAKVIDVTLNSKTIAVGTIEPESRFLSIVVTPQTKLVNVYGLPMTLQDLSTRSIITVTGTLTDVDSMTPTAITVRDTSLADEITVYDAGQTFTYKVGSRFTVILHGGTYPSSALLCAPADIVTRVSTAPKTGTPLTAVQFEAVREGTCVLKNGVFTATVTVTP